MTDLQAPNLEEERRLAHTGALARIASRFAHHPWRVIFSWLGIFVVLIGLNAAFHGKLINDFNIPGSDIQKATDLINAKFGGQKGAALRVVSPRRRASSSTRPSAQAAIKQDARRGQRSQRTLDEDPKRRLDITTRWRRLAPALEDGRIAFFDVQYDQTGFELPRVRTSSTLEDQIRAIGDPAGHPGRVHRRGRERAADAGAQRHHRPASRRSSS